MRYDGKSLGTEASDHVRNLRLMQDAAKCVMREEQHLDFKEDIFRESCRVAQPDGLRCVFVFRF